MRLGTSRPKKLWLIGMERDPCQIKCSTLKKSTFNVRFMDLPRRFTYGPQWRQVGLFWAVVVALLVLAGVHWISLPVAVIFGIIPLGAALTGTLRRMFRPRFLELEPDALLLPIGRFQQEITRIGYADIEHTVNFAHPQMPFLKLQTKGRTLTISRILLPDMASYVAIKDFILSRVSPAAKVPPGQDQPVEAGKYGFQCSYEGNGAIFASNGTLLWRCKTLHSGKPRYPYGFFRLPDFVVSDPTGQEWLRVKVVHKLALAQFVMIQNGQPACTLRQRSLFRNKYALNFANGQKWVFRMPLFTVLFAGQSETGAKVRARMRGHNVWYVQLEPAGDNPQLVAALAFIHRERLRFN